ACQLGGTGVQTAVNVDLLVRGRAVAAVARGRFVERHLHAGEDLAGELAAADRIEGDGGTGLDQRVGEVVGEGRRGRVDDVLGADVAQGLRLGGAAHDVDQAD